MKYLVNFLQSFETSHSDALYPGEVEKHKTFLAEDELHKPVTRAKLCVDLQSAFVTTTKENQPFPAILGRPYSLVDQPYGFSPKTPSIAWQMKALADLQRGIPAVGMPTTLQMAPVTIPVMLFQNTQQGGPREAGAVDMSRANAEHCSPHHEQPSLETHATAYIPNLTCGFHSWHEAVCQWEERIPTQGIPPLRDWDKSLFTKRMREKTGAKRRIRQIIAYEYNR